MDNVRTSPAPRGRVVPIRFAGLACKPRQLIGAYRTGIRVCKQVDTATRQRGYAGLSVQSGHGGRKAGPNSDDWQSRDFSPVTGRSGPSDNFGMFHESVTGCAQAKKGGPKAAFWCHHREKNTRKKQWRPMYLYSIQMRKETLWNVRISHYKTRKLDLDQVACKVVRTVMACTAISASLPDFPVVAGMQPWPHTGNESCIKDHR